MYSATTFYVIINVSLRHFFLFCDEKGSAVILKNNTPRYLIIDFAKLNAEETASDEDVMALSRRFMKKNKEAYEVLAK